jgi:signal transduction histidine kinase
MSRRCPAGIKITWVNADKAADIKVPFNAPLFDWVLENLTKNALDAMEKGKGEITFEVFDLPKLIAIEVRDSGHGIPPNKIKTVFNPGFTTKKRGWGLGLSLCKRIVEDYHLGKIYVKESSPQKGTTFRIELLK